MNIVVSLLVSICISVLTALILAFPFGGLNPAIAASALSAGIIAGALNYNACRKHGNRSRVEKIGPWDWFAIITFTLFSLRAFCWLVFRDGDQIQILSPNNLGDLALHITYINNLANGVPFWPENPIFAGSKVHYPLGIDIFNALLTLAGVDVYRGLIWVGLLCCSLTGIAFYKWGRGFALAGFLFNGGLAGFQFLTKKGFVLADFQESLAWKSIPLSMFVTQRGLLYAIPAGLVLLCSWRQRFFSGKPDDERKPLPFWVEVLLYSTMPLFHLHTFIFLSLLLGCWFLLSLINRNPDSQSWNATNISKLLAWSFVPATVLVVLITGAFKSSSVVHFTSDWMYDDQAQFGTWAASFGLPQFFSHLLGHAACWMVNFGLFPFLIVTLVTVLIRNRKSASSAPAIAFVFPSLLIFVFSFFVMLAPWDWDNTKIMIWPYFVVLPFLWDQLLAKRRLLLRGACCFALYFSGFITLVGGIDTSHTGYDFASCSELEGVASAVRKIPVTATFAAIPTYNHPLLLNGRNMVMGYTGHLWSHGIDFEGQLAKLNFLLDGRDGWQQTAAELHARYLFWGDREKQAHAESLQPWKESCQKVAEGPWGEIYDLEATSPVAP
ncbi:MAG: hypothetical protein WCD79_21860 [Chthoniobacteraceae bacterium]